MKYLMKTFAGLQASKQDSPAYSELTVYSALPNNKVVN